MVIVSKGDNIWGQNSKDFSFGSTPNKTIIVINMITSIRNQDDDEAFLWKRQLSLIMPAALLPSSPPYSTLWQPYSTLHSIAMQST